MFPQSFIDKIKNTVNLVKLAGQYTEVKKAGPFLHKALCPHPEHADKDPSFRIWEKGYKTGNEQASKYDSWSCMVCHYGKKGDRFNNKGSDCIAFIQWIENKSWKEAVIFLANKYQISIPTDKNEKLYKEKKRLALSYRDNLNGSALQYLKNRGLDEYDCEKWMLGFDGLKIVFPLLDRYKNVLAYTRRWLSMPENSNDKYKNSCNSSIFNKSMYLYGLQNIDESFDEIRITEGPMDVILADKYKLRNIFSPLGTAFTEGHIEIIKHYGKTPVFCMDGDEAGLKSINRSIVMLADHGIYSKLLILPQGKDLADVTLEEKENIENYVSENSITYGNYLIQKELNLYEAKVNELKLKSYPKLLKVLAKVPSQEERNILKSFVKTKMNIDM